MSLRKAVSISLSPELHAAAERIRALRRYNNFSEVVRACLRLLDGGRGISKTINAWPAAINETVVQGPLNA